MGLWTNSWQRRRKQLAMLLLVSFALLQHASASCVLNITTLLVVPDSVICYNQGECLCLIPPCKIYGQCACAEGRYEFDGTPSSDAYHANCSSTPSSLYPTFVRLATQGIVAACALGLIACFAAMVALYKHQRLGFNASTTSAIVFGLQFIAWAFATLVNPVELQTSSLSTAYFQILTAIPEAMWLIGFSTLFLVWRTLWAPPIPPCCCCRRRGRRKKRGFCVALYKWMSLSPIFVLIAIALLAAAILLSVLELPFYFFAISRLYLLLMCIALILQVIVSSAAQSDIGGRKLIRMSILSVILAFVNLTLDCYHEFGSELHAHTAIIWWILLRGLALIRGLVCLVSTSPGAHNALNEDGSTLHQPYGPAQGQAYGVHNIRSPPVARNGSRPAGPQRQRTNTAAPMRKRPSQLVYEQELSEQAAAKRATLAKTRTKNRVEEDDDGSSSSSDDDDERDDKHDAGSVADEEHSSQSDDDEEKQRSNANAGSVAVDGMDDHDGNGDSEDPGILNLDDEASTGDQPFQRGPSMHPLQELISKPAVDVIAERNQPEARMIIALRGEYERKWTDLVDPDEAARAAKEEFARSASSAKLGGTPSSGTSSIRRLDFSRVKEEAAEKTVRDLQRTERERTERERAASSRKLGRAASKYALNGDQSDGGAAGSPANGHNRRLSATGSPANGHHRKLSSAGTTSPAAAAGISHQRRISINTPGGGNGTSSIKGDEVIALLTMNDSPTASQRGLARGASSHTVASPTVTAASTITATRRPSNTPSAPTFTPPVAARYRALPPLNGSPAAATSTSPTTSNTTLLTNGTTPMGHPRMLQPALSTRMLTAGPKALPPINLPSVTSATGKCNFAISVGGRCQMKCVQFIAKNGAPATCICGHSILTHALDEPELIVPPPQIIIPIPSSGASSTASDGSSSAAIICSNCDEATATIRCAECDQRLCAACDTDLHGPVKMATHHRRPLHDAAMPRQRRGVSLDVTTANNNSNGVHPPISDTSSTAASSSTSTLDSAAAPSTTSSISSSTPQLAANNNNDDAAPAPPPDDDIKTSAPPGSIEDGAIPLCDNCEQLAAAVRCDQCTMNLCVANQCDAVMHRAERTRKHIRRPLL